MRKYNYFPSDGKKRIQNRIPLRRDLQLEDAEGVDCLPNATIFEQLTLMWYEKLSQKLTSKEAYLYLTKENPYSYHFCNAQLAKTLYTALNEFSIEKFCHTAASLDAEAG
ncbi:hypothetical protein Tco_0980760 [Tanacetum coccineum]